MLVCENPMIVERAERTQGGLHRAERAWKLMTTREAWPQAQHWLSRSITAASPVAMTLDCRTCTALGRQLLLLLLHLHLLLLPYNCLLAVCSSKALGMPPCPEPSFVASARRVGTARTSGLWCSVLARGESRSRRGDDSPHRFAIGDRRFSQSREPPSAAVLPSVHRAA